jgi:uncharacterized protein (DUF1501 family)
MSDDCETVSLVTRRRVLGTAGALFALSFVPKPALAGPGADDLRVLVVVLRGAMDGLAAIPPMGDPAYAEIRGSLALDAGGAHPVHRLDSFFAAHPAMPNLARLYRADQASVVHAVATPSRERSHFSAQEVLESGLPGASHADAGWLNRAFGGLTSLGSIPPKGVLGVGVLPPLVARGPAPVLGWAPAELPDAPPGLAERVLALYAVRDPELGKVLSSGIQTDAMADGMKPGMSGDPGPAKTRSMRATAAGLARLMAAPDGPRLGAVAFGGWDTHANQGGATGQLALLLAGLDDSLALFEQGFGAVWKRTAVVVITEFGRSARVNGTVGSDHGTGTVALLVGGAVRGGRVITDWPGIAERQLFEGRDLAPTTDLRAVLKGILQQGYDLPEKFLAETVFPETAAIRPMRDLLV